MIRRRAVVPAAAPTLAHDDSALGGEQPWRLDPSTAPTPLARDPFSPFTHSSTLRTIQELLGVGPFLGDAVNATNLSDLFQSFP